MDFEDAFFDTDDFKITNQKLGEGSFGKVYIVICLKDKAQYAAKIINSSNLIKGRQQMMLIRESGILHKLHHPSIIKFYGINFHSFDDPNQLQPTIITEYLEHGSLRDVIDKSKKETNKKWNITKRYICLLGIADAMRYLHEQGILHRDLKPQNVLIDSDYYPRVCDFGLSKCFNQTLTPTIQLTMTSEIGSPLYMAPELFLVDDDDDSDDKASHHFGPGIDVYAFAMIMYEITSEKVPFMKNGKLPSIIKLSQMVNKGIRPDLTDNLTQKMKNLLNRCWSGNPQVRPPFSEIFDLLSSDFSYFIEKVDESEVKSYINLLKKSRKSEHKMNNKKESSSVNTSDQPDKKDGIFIDTSEEKQFHTKPIQICEGRNSIKYKVFDKRTKTVMCKVVIKLNSDSSKYKLFTYAMNEFQIMQILSHPCICKTINFNCHEETKESIKDDEMTTVAIFFEYLQYNLNDVLSMNISNTLKVRIVLDIAHGMKYIHNNNIIHRNLNIRHIMLNEFFETKIIGFRNAEIIKYKDNEFNPIEAGIREYKYMAPEIMEEKEDCDNKVDVYSFGIILYVMFVGTLPKQTMSDKLRGKPIKLPSPSKSISSFCIKLIEQCLSFLPSKRPSFEIILNQMRENSFELIDDVNSSLLIKRDEELNFADEKKCISNLL